MRRGIAGAAALIALLTVASRVFGFGRNVVFTLTVGPTDLGDIYLAANTVPNIIFEIVAGGALAGLVVPLLAAPIAEGDRARVRSIASALLTWAVVILIPLAALVAGFADQVIALLAPDSEPVVRETGARMLRVFAPQLPLYGIGIVLTGVLQAHRRFAWPVIAPLLSSVTVIATYLAFGAAAGLRPDPGTVSGGATLLLAAGTTAGVAALTLCLVIPVIRLGVTLRPTFLLSPAQRAEAARLALAGVVMVIAQQLALLVAIRLALAASDGTNTIYNMAEKLYLLPWAVLALPSATAAYPVIAAAHVTGDTDALRATVSRTGHTVVWLGCLGAAGLVAIADPVGALVMVDDPRQAHALTWAIVGFAPGLVGYGLAALHQRTLYAVGAQRDAAVAVGLGWVVAAGASVVFSLALPAADRATALALGNSAGMTVLGVALTIAVARRCSRSALRAVPRTAGVAGLAAAAAAGVATAAGAAMRPPAPGNWALIGQGMLAGAVAALVFVTVCAALDRSGTRAMAGRVIRLLRARGKGDGTA